MELELPESEVIACLFSLQRHAIEKYVFEAVFKLLAVCKLERNLLVKTYVWIFTGLLNDKRSKVLARRLYA